MPFSQRLPEGLKWDQVRVLDIPVSEGQQIGKNKILLLVETQSGVSEIRFRRNHAQVREILVQTGDMMNAGMVFMTFDAIEIANNQEQEPVTQGEHKTRSARKMETENLDKKVENNDDEKFTPMQTMVSIIIWVAIGYFAWSYFFGEPEYNKNVVSMIGDSWNNGSASYNKFIVSGGTIYRNSDNRPTKYCATIDNKSPNILKGGNFSFELQNKKLGTLKALETGFKLQKPIIPFHMGEGCAILTTKKQREGVKASYHRISVTSPVTEQFERNKEFNKLVDSWL